MDDVIVSYRQVVALFLGRRGFLVTFVVSRHVAAARVDVMGLATITEFRRGRRLPIAVFLFNILP